MTRTQEEIVDRINSVDDWWGWRREVLIDGLDYAHAKPYLTAHNEYVSEREWAEYRAGNPIGTQARDYLDFAVGKILGHRSLPVAMSVAKLREYAWLMGRDDVMTAMDAADYPKYGAPRIRAFALAMGWPRPSSPRLARMAKGLPCVDECEECAL